MGPTAPSARRGPGIPRLAVLLAAVALAACGGAPEGPRIEILTSTVDGAPPADLEVRSLQGANETYPLVRVEAEGAGTYVAVGAPDGLYAVRAPGHWGMLWPNPEPPRLRRDAPEPVAVQLGRPHTLYVVSKQVGQVPGATWAVEAVGQPPRPVAVRVETDDRGLAAVRFAPADWKGDLRAVGRMEAGAVTTEVRFQAPADGRPFLARVEAAPVDSLRVIDVGRPPADGRLVRLRVTGIPLPIVFERPLEDGTARFDGVPYFDRPLAVSIGDAPATFEIDSREWLETREMRLFLPPEGARAVRVRVPRVEDVSEVQVLAPGAESYGAAGFSARGGALDVPVPEGDVALLVRAGDRWAAVPSASAGGEVEVGEADLEPAGSATVRVEGGAGRVQFRRVEGERRVLARGFVRTVEVGSDTTARLPAGEYRVSLETGARTVELAAPVRVAPGATATVRIDARR